MGDSSEEDIKTAEEYTDPISNIATRPKKKVRVSIDQTSEIRKMSLKVPSFSPDEPEIWFALLESQFEHLGITDDSVKFTSVTTNLDLHHAKAVKDIILHPPRIERYPKIKTELIRRLSASKEKKVKQLLTHEELGDRKPSEFLRHLQDLAGPSVPQDFIRTMWCGRLPSSLQTVLASQPSHSLEQLADLADRIQELTSPCNVAATSAGPSHHQTVNSDVMGEIAALRRMVQQLSVKLEDQTCNRSNRRSRPQRRRSPSRPRSRSNSSYNKYPVCWYHSKFGSNAKQCVKPCDFKKAGNFSGSR